MRSSESCVARLNAPIPEVVTNSRSAPPRSTTFVSPVTISTPASSPARFIEPAISSTSLRSIPSSRIIAQLSAKGSAPLTARSFTVPHTASLPMSPPGKNRGFTTYESVVNARRGTVSRIAESPRGARDELLKRGRKTFSTSSWESLPPLPWARRILSGLFCILCNALERFNVIYIYSTPRMSPRWRPYTPPGESRGYRRFRRARNPSEP